MVSTPKQWIASINVAPCEGSFRPLAAEHCSVATSPLATLMVIA